MFIFLDALPEPTMKIIEETTEPARSVPWIAAYVVIGALICAAAIIVIKQLRKK